MFAEDYQTEHRNRGVYSNRLGLLLLASCTGSAHSGKSERTGNISFGGDTPAKGNFLRNIVLYPELILIFMAQGARDLILNDGHNYVKCPLNNPPADVPATRTAGTSAALSVRCGKASGFVCCYPHMTARNSHLPAIIDAAIEKGSTLKITYDRVKTRIVGPETSFHERASPDFRVRLSGKKWDPPVRPNLLTSQFVKNTEFYPGFDNESK
ncbi:hypothetical protein PROFUN_16882 [Planoprotostelium fungivorum]|uniref:Uncharacterized protein n=1 Tax=Planoprotostelium fungivorum TaxID=1890364 RepID=A0A2P6MNN6_9EUKA|nr:hypothetical protein PROFUN_16882 [Planoprotostelium fungivorum]